MAAMISSPAAMLTGSPGQSTASRADDRLVGGMPPQCATNRSSFKSSSNTWHVRANTRRKSHGIRCESTEPQHETPGPPPALTSPDAAKAAEALGDLGLPLTFDVERRMPIRPPEWAEEERKRRERQVAAQGGVKIRRRPPSGPPSHSVGPFEFKIENDDNKPINILEEIVWHKDFELVRMKESMSLPAVMKGLPSAPPVRDFVGELRKRLGETGVPALIAEVKKASPSRGVIQPDFDPVRIALAYEEGGAACLSVLTDSKYFQCPLLCKEFVVDAWQIYFARLKGADAVLLIAAVLPDQDLKYLSKIAKALGMASLIEVHTEVEMDRVLGLERVELIGINNRNLETFEVDIQNTTRLLSGERGQKIRDRGILVVGESGLFVPDDVALVQEAGCGAVLVGESLVKQTDPATGIARLFGKDISRRASDAPHPLATNA